MAAPFVLHAGAFDGGEGDGPEMLVHADWPEVFRMREIFDIMGDERFSGRNIVEAAIGDLSGARRSRWVSQ